MDRSDGWHVSEQANNRILGGKTIGRTVKTAAVIGAGAGFATAGMAWVRFEEEAGGFSQRYYALVRELQRANPSDYALVTSIAVELLGEINLYLAQLSPTSEPFDMAMVISIYGYLATSD